MSEQIVSIEVVFPEPTISLIGVASPSAVAAEPPNGNYRFKNGQFQLWDEGSECWRAMFPHNGAPAISDPIPE